jgi:uncharacterized protein YjiS (DUF1127 family)
MRTISGAPAAPPTLAGRSESPWLPATLKHWWVAFMKWRIARAAAAQLGAMSDRELWDLGLHRSGVSAAVARDDERTRRR